MKKIVSLLTASALLISCADITAVFAYAQETAPAQPSQVYEDAAPETGSDDTEVLDDIFSDKYTDVGGFTLSSDTAAEPFTEEKSASGYDDTRYEHDEPLPEYIETEELRKEQEEQRYTEEYRKAEERYMGERLDTAPDADGFEISNGVLWSYTGNATDVVVPDGVRSIGKEAFALCKARSIYLPDTVKMICESAFTGCEMSTINLPDSIQCIMDGAFYGTKNLRSVRLPDSIEYIWRSTFANSGVSEVYIGRSVVSVESFAFLNCKDLKSIKIPPNVQDIESDAFLDAGLTSVKLSSGLRRICNRAFKGTSITSLEIPGSVKMLYSNCFSGMSALREVVLRNGVGYIPDSAFEGCTAIEKIYIPGSAQLSTGFMSNMPNLSEVVLGSGITGIYSASFNNLPSLSKITIPGTVKFIGNGAFLNCETLSEIVIEEGVETIEEYAFRNCPQVRDVVIPKTVKSVGHGAFEDMTALESVSITGNTSVGNTAFLNCPNLKKLTVSGEEGSNVLKALTYLDGLELTVTGSHIAEEFAKSQLRIKSVRLSDDITAIPDSAFDGCTNLSFIYMPEGLKEIGDYAFRLCTALDHIYIPNGVKSIGGYAFIGCSGLPSVIIPGSVETIGEHAFEGCTGLTEVSLFGGLKAIENNAFANCSELASVELPASLQYLGGSAFIYCRSLGSISIPSAVATLHESTFCGCTALTDVTLSSGLISIEAKVFRDSGITSIFIPDTVQNIGAFAFENCASLTTASLPDVLRTLGSNAFQHDVSLTSINIPASLEIIDEYTFSGCSALSTVTFEEGVLEIGDYAFEGDYSITSISLPNTMNVVGRYAFIGCTGMTSFTSHKDSLIYYQNYDSANTFSGCTGLRSVTWCYTSRPIESVTDVYYVGQSINVEIYKNESGLLPASVIEDDEYGKYNLHLITGNYNTIHKDPDYVIRSVYCGYRDLVFEPVDVILPYSEDPVYMINLYIRTNAANSATAYLYQKGQQLASARLDRGNGRIEYAIKRENVGDGFKVRVYFSETRYDECELKLTVKDSDFEEDKEVYLSLADSNLEVTMPDSVDLVGGQKLDFGGLSDPISLQFKLFPDGRFRIGLNVNSEVLSDDKRSLKLKEQLDSAMHLTQLNSKSLGEFAKNSKKTLGKFLNTDLTLNIIGYAEGVLKKDCNIEFIKLDALIQVNCKWDLEHQIVIGYIPVVLGVTLDVSMACGVTFYVDPQNSSWQFAAKVPLRFDFSLFGGVGVRRLATVGIKGGLIIEPTVYLCSTVGEGRLDNVKITGGIWGRAYVGPFKWEAPCVEKQWLYNYSTGKWTSKTYWLGDNPDTSGNSASPTGSYDLSNTDLYTVYDNDATSMGASSPLYRDIYMASEPSVVPFGDEMVMTYLDIDPSRSDVNSTVLMYSVFSGGKWSAPLKVDGNDTADYKNRLFKEGDNIYLVYTECDSVLADDAGVSDFASHLGTTVAVFDPETRVFRDFTRLSAEGKYCSVFDMENIGGVPTIAWVQSSEYDFFGAHDRNEIAVSRFDGAWSAPEIVKSGMNSTLSIALTDNGIFYITDADNDLFRTCDDRMLMRTGVPDDQAVISTGGIDALCYEETDPDNHKKAVLWYESNKIMKYADGESAKLYDIDGEVYEIQYDRGDFYCLMQDRNGYDAVACVMHNFPNDSVSDIISSSSTVNGFGVCNGKIIYTEHYIDPDDSADDYTCMKEDDWTYVYVPDGQNIKDISVVAPTPQRKFYTGYDLDLTDYELKVTFNDKRSENIPLALNYVSGYNKDKAGQQTLTVNYCGKTTTLRITVLEDKVKSIEPGTDDKAPKTEYRYLEPFDTDTGKLIVTYDSGKTGELALSADGVTITGYNNEKTGTQKITVKYGAKTTSYNITLNLYPEDCPINVGNKGYLKLADAVRENDSGEVTFTIKRSYTDKSAISFPKTLTEATLRSDPGAVLTLSNLTINANCDLVLDCEIAPSDKKAKTITVRSAADKKVRIDRLDTALPLTLSGTKTTDVIIFDDIDIVSAAAVNIGIAAGSKVTVDSGKFTPTKLDGNGSIDAYNDSTLTIADAEKATITLHQYAGRNNAVLLPKLSIGTPTDVTVTVKDTDGEDADIAGQTILTLAKQDNIASLETKIKFTNKDGTNTLSAVQYKKDVRAEWLDALTMNNGTEDVNYSSFEKAFEKITEESAAADKAKPKQAYKSYTITLNTDMAPDKFALPMKAAGITILGGDHALSLTGVTSLAPRYALTLKNVNVTARDKQGKAAALAINGADTLTVDGLLFDGKSLTVSSTKGDTIIKDVTVPDDVPFIIKGGTKNDLTISGCPLVNQLTGFDAITLSDEMKIEKTFTTNTLDLGTTGDLVTGDDPTAKKLTPAAITIKKELKANGGKITLSEGFKPLTISAAASGNIKLVSEEAIADTVQILNAAKCDLSVFDVSGIKGGSTDYALTRTQAKVYCKKTKLSMDGKKFVTFADVVSAIEAANDPTAEYEITLLEDYDNGAALKFPKAGTYGKISIATGTKKFTFTGNVTLTGNTAISGTFYAFDSRKNAPAKYTIATAKEKTFGAADANLGAVTSIGLGTTDITLTNVTFTEACKITANKFTFSGITGIIDTLTVNTIKADGAQTLKLLEKKQHKVNTAQDAASGTITVLMVGADGKAAALKNNAVIFASFKGDTFNVDIENAGFGLSRETKGQFKVTATLPKA